MQSTGRSRVNVLFATERTKICILIPFFFLGCSNHSFFKDNPMKTSFKSKREIYKRSLGEEEEDWSERRKRTNRQQEVCLWKERKKEGSSMIADHTIEAVYVSLYTKKVSSVTWSVECRVECRLKWRVSLWVLSVAFFSSFTSIDNICTFYSTSLIVKGIPPF